MIDVSKSSLSHKLKAFLPYIIIFFFLFDFITKALIIYTNNFPFYRFGALIKGLFLIAIFYIAVRTKISHLRVFFNYSIALITVFLVSFLFFNTSISDDDFYFNFYYLIKYIYPLLFLTLLPTLNKNDISLAIRMFTIFIAVNSALIIIGGVFEIDLFRSYYGGPRFGYLGLLLYHAEAGYIYFLAIMIIYHNVKEKKGKYNWLVALLCWSSMFMVGTKKSIGLALLFFLFVIVDNRQFIIKKYKASLVFFLSGIGLVIYFNQEILNSLSLKFKLLLDVYNKEGLITTFFSYRNENLISKIFPYIEENWSLINWFLGGPSFKNYRVELELVDLFLFFGIFGIVIYSLVFIKIKNLFNSKYFTFLTITLLLASFISGNFLASINSFIIYIFTILYLIKPNQHKID